MIALPDQSYRRIVSGMTNCVTSWSRDLAWDVDSRIVTRIPHVVWKPKVHYSVFTESATRRCPDSDESSPHCHIVSLSFIYIISPSSPLFCNIFGIKWYRILVIRVQTHFCQIITSLHCIVTQNNVVILTVMRTSNLNTFLHRVVFPTTVQATVSAVLNA
jgi:hypothetical protein